MAMLSALLSAALPLAALSPPVEINRLFFFASCLPTQHDANAIARLREAGVRELLALVPSADARDLTTAASSVLDGTRSLDDADELKPNAGDAVVCARFSELVAVRDSSYDCARLVWVTSSSWRTPPPSLSPASPSLIPSPARGNCFTVQPSS